MENVSVGERAGTRVWVGERREWARVSRRWVKECHGVGWDVRRNGETIWACEDEPEQGYGWV